MGSPRLNFRYPPGYLPFPGALHGGEGPPRKSLPANVYLGVLGTTRNIHATFTLPISEIGGIRLIRARFCRGSLFSTS